MKNLSISKWSPIIFMFIGFLIFSLALKGVYSTNITSLSDSKLDSYYTIDYDLSVEQEREFNNNGKYKFISKHSCDSNYLCEVHEYLKPPYRQKDRGYIIFLESEEEIIKTDYFNNNTDIQIYEKNYRNSSSTIEL